MRYFPVFMDLAGSECLVIGATDEARRKADMLCTAGATVRRVADPTADLTRRCGRWVLAVVATGDAAADASASSLLKELQVPVNVVDRPDLCTFIWPAIVERDPVTIAISTAGTSPLLAKLIRLRIERAIPAAFGTLAALAGSVRRLIRLRISDSTQRRRFWQEVLTGGISDLVLAGRLHEAKAMLYRRIFADDALRPRALDGVERLAPP